ncbi:dimethylamine monooxygenase subunit DmmA family protein [Granulosicoccaceae sp. 1_MG-2023]|nr:dimethylamine monooxygenase subunit DmmA family protein [Granulosicoccaceae sp. 1_MG-2023]
MNDAVASYTVKSRPDYHEVAPDQTAQCHVFITDSAGLAQSEALCQASPVAKKQAWHIGDSDTLPAGYEAIQSGDWQAVLGEQLSGFGIATAFYVSGLEAFLWQVHGVLTKAGFAPSQIHLEPPAGNQRDVFCTHCYHITPDVSTTPARCAGCGRLLLVRDHFSRLHCAYVGVQINAEDPAEVPPTEELS